jgi:hypothetical protein
LRRQVELERRSIVLKKAQRSDIVSGEAALSEGDVENLKTMERILKQMQASMARIDSIVMLLRDY